MQMIEEEGLLERTQQLGALFRQRLEGLRKECDIVREVRVLGLMIGVELAVEGAEVVKGCMQRRLLINCTHNTVIRLLPAMTLTDEQVEEGCDILASVIKELPA